MAFLFFGVLFVCAAIVGPVAERWGLPRVAFYILVGLAFSQDILGQLIYPHGEYWGQEIGDIALTFIAFQIGTSLFPSDLKRGGLAITLGALGNALGAVVFVFVALMTFATLNGIENGFRLSVVLAAIASTTAPAGTMAVIHQFKARGLLTKTLLGMVIVDDAIGVVLFSIATGLLLAQNMSSLLSVAFVEIVGSIALGAGLGLIFVSIIRWSSLKTTLLALIVGSMLIVVNIAQVWPLSSLLIGMSMGFSINLRMHPHCFLDKTLEHLEEVVYMALFLIAGCHFQSSVFGAALPWILIYFVFRVLGKYSGAFIGLQMANADRKVRNLVGHGLIPQAGVAVGLALLVGKQSEFSGIAPIVINVVLASTFISELIGPILTKWALRRAGEIG